MGYYATQTARSFLTLQRDVLHPSSELRVRHARSQQAFCLLDACCLLGLLFNPEDEGDMIRPIRSHSSSPCHCYKQYTANIFQ
jgi:hypothetical protein